VTATGATSYQWYIGASGVTTAPIAGATSPSLTVTPASTTSYWVRLTNACGTLDSTAATITVTAAISPTNDFNGDGKPDFVFRNYATGQNLYWYLNGVITTTTGLATAPADPNMSLEGVGDLNGDGQPDLVWRNYATGENTVWFMNGTVASSTAALPSFPDTNWKLDAIGDFNGDGKPDLVWRNYATGENLIWLMNGTTVTAQVGIPALADTSSHIEAAGDFNGDGKPDLVWRNYTTGKNFYWYMNGTTFVSASATFVQLADLNWHFDTVGDYNGDGHMDLVLRNYVTGGIRVWTMNNTVQLGNLGVATLAPVWKLSGRGMTPPTPTISGAASFCTTSTVTLTSSTATGNHWSTGETTQSITITAPGTYTVTVTNALGSATSAAKVVAPNPVATPTITGPSAVSAGSTITLTSSSATGNLWSTGETTQSITVSTEGSYSVTVTGAGGCSAASAPLVVTTTP
jgi:hypothetical protein